MAVSVLAQAQALEARSSLSSTGGHVSEAREDVWSGGTCQLEDGKQVPWDCIWRQLMEIGQAGAEWQWFDQLCTALDTVPRWRWLGRLMVAWELRRTVEQAQLHEKLAQQWYDLAYFHHILPGEFDLPDGDSEDGDEQDQNPSQLIEDA